VKVTIDLWEGWFLWSIDSCVSDMPREVFGPMNTELSAINYTYYENMGYPFHLDPDNSPKLDHLLVRLL
jgi:hypothetical protein